MVDLFHEYYSSCPNREIRSAIGQIPTPLLLVYFVVFLLFFPYPCHRHTSEVIILLREGRHYG